MGRDLEETNRNLDQMVDLALQLQQETGVKLLWACLPVPRTPAGPSLTLRPTCSLWLLLRSGRVWRWPRSSELRDLVSCCCVYVCNFLEDTPYSLVVSWGGVFCLFCYVSLFIIIMIVWPHLLCQNTGYSLM